MTTGHLTPDDVTRLGRAAGFRWPWPRAETLQDHLDIAVSGAWITYLSTPDATSSDILRGAWKTLGQEYMRIRPLPKLGIAYWTTPPPDPFEEALDRIATRQVLRGMTRDNRDAIILTSELVTTQRVAITLEIPEWKVRRRVRDARTAFARRWHSPDTPPPLHEIRRDERKAC